MSTLDIPVRDKTQDQLDLEIEMGSMGISNYFKKLEKQGQGVLQPGMALIDNSLSPLIAQLEEFCESTRSGKAQRLTSTARYFEMIGLKEVAYITLKRVINGLSSRDRMVSMAESMSAPCIPTATRISICCGRSAMLPSIFKRYDFSRVLKPK